MVKGVSKTIIEVNNTGSKVFEKVVFYVTPEYSNSNRGQLNQAASKFISTYDLGIPEKNSLRKRHKKRKIRKSVFVFLGILALVGISLLFICK